MSRTAPVFAGSVRRAMEAAARYSGSRRWFVLAAVGAELLAAVLVAVWNLGEKPLWADEVDAVSVARMPLDVIVQPSLSRQSNMVVYGVFLKVWRGVGGEGAAWLRAPAAAMSIVAVPVAIMIGRRLGGVAVGLMAGALLTANGLWVRFAQENRPYALTLLAATIGGWCLVRAVETGSWRWWACWSGAGALVVYGHPVAGAVVVSQAVALLALGRSLPWRRAAVAIIAFGVLCMPQLILARQEPWQDRVGLPPATPSRLREVAGALLGGSAVRHLLLLFLILTTATLMAKRGTTPMRRFGLALSVSWAALPLVVATVMSNVTEPVLHPRYLVGSLPGLALAASIGLVALRHWALPALLGGVLLLTGAQTVRDQYALPKEDYRSAAASLGRLAQASDGLVVGHPFWRQPLEYYLLREVTPDRRPVPISPREPWGTYPPQGGSISISLDIVARFDRIWLVGPSVAPWIGNVEGIVTASHHLVAETHFERVLVRLYQVGEHPALS